MNELQVKLRAFLHEAGRKLRDTSLPGDLAAATERLAEQVDQPCVVAIVGRMKAGKSTFINALLGDDLAKVGVTETTATINYFRYGTPNPARPVRCYWQNGSVTEEDRAFLDNLQGHDIETLRRAEGIKYLEYSLLNPYLERVTLVDTPGMSAAVDEHAHRTAEFLALQRQLRDRHNAETQQVGSEATAIIYLVGQVARMTDQAFLEEFGEITGGGSKALNAVGVLAKVDVHEVVLKRRHELAAKIAGQLKENLNTVVAVSAGIERAVDRLRAKGPSGIVDFLATLKQIPSHRLEKFLADAEFYRELEAEDCPVSIAQRRHLLGEMPWAVFTTLARSAAGFAFDPVAAEVEWRSLAGFDRLREVLDRHLFQRAYILRCYQVVQQVRHLLEEVRYRHLPQRRQHGREQKARLERFVQFVRRAKGDPAVAKELEAFLYQQNALPGDSEKIEAVWKELDRRQAGFVHELEEANADFEALQMLGAHAILFTAEELDELRSLFGLCGLEPAKRVAGDLAVQRYGGRFEDR